MLVCSWIAVRRRAITSSQTLTFVVGLLYLEKRVSYRRLQKEFAIDGATLEDLRHELAFKRLAVDEDGQGFVFIGAAFGDAGNVEYPASEWVAAGMAAAHGAVAARVPALQAPTLGPPAATATAEAARRQLTVMFCDLVGSTPLSTGLDPEDLRDVITSFQNRCRQAIKRYDGFIARFMGDGILVYFGYPRAHEDDAERSARAGLDIVVGMTEFNAELGKRHKVELAVRVGIATGPVIVGGLIGEGAAEEASVVGETPNLAARLQALAQPNQVVVSRTTRRMLGDYFELQDLGALELKGFREPVEVWRVLSERDVESRFAATRTGSSAPLVGRQEEMGLLLRAWEGSCQGRGRVVLIQGEAGVGKSRLVEGLRQAIGNDHTRVAIRCSAFHTASAFHPIIEHLKRVFGWLPEDTVQQRLAKLEGGLVELRTLPLSESVRLFADLMSLPLPNDLYACLTMTAQQQRSATIDALLAWLIEVTERAPVLMVWEDLHWADPSTLETLGMLIEQAPTVPMLIVATYRPELTPPWQQRFAHDSDHTQPPRATGGGEHDELPRRRDVPARRGGRSYRCQSRWRTALRGGADQGHCRFGNSRSSRRRLRLKGSLSNLNIPETLQDSLMARLDRVPRLREVAQLGAVLGREFAYNMISALVGLEERVLQSGLGQLVVDELLYQRGRPPRSHYMFKHALIQDAAYQSLLKRTRQQYHEQVAKLLEDRFPEVVSTQPELVAHHYTEANCPASAIAFWLRAGMAAARQSANVEAICQFYQGLALVDSLPDERERAERERDLQMALGPALIATRITNNPDVGRTYARARELCEQLGLRPDVHRAPRSAGLPVESARDAEVAAFRRGRAARGETARRCGPSGGWLCDCRPVAVLPGKTRAGAGAIPTGLRDVRSGAAAASRLAGCASRTAMPVLPDAYFLDARLPGSVARGARSCGQKC